MAERQYSQSTHANDDSVDDAEIAFLRRLLESAHSAPPFPPPGAGLPARPWRFSPPPPFYAPPASQEGTQQTSFIGIITLFVIFLLLLVVWYACIIGPARLREDEAQGRRRGRDAVEKEVEEMRRRYIGRVGAHADLRWREDDEVYDNLWNRSVAVRIHALFLSCGDFLRGIISFCGDYIGYWVRVCVEYLHAIVFALSKVAGSGLVLLILFRVVRFFMKEEYQREGNRVDEFIEVGLHFVASVGLILGFPILVVVGIGIIVGHDDAVQVCDLCDDGHGRRPICQSYINYTNNRPLCTEHRWSEENRIAAEKAEEAEQRYWQSLKKKRKGDLRKASILPSGLRFSPVPFSLQPHHPSASGQSYNSVDAGGRYSGSRLRSPRAEKNGGQQMDLYNAFNARRTLLKPIGEEGIEEDLSMGTGVGGTKIGVEGRKYGSWKEAWYTEQDLRLPPETQRTLWPEPPTSRKSTAPPIKRFT